MVLWAVEQASHPDGSGFDMSFASYYPPDVRVRRVNYIPSYVEFVGSLTPPLNGYVVICNRHIPADE